MMTIFNLLWGRMKFLKIQFIIIELLLFWQISCKTSQNQHVVNTDISPSENVTGDVPQNSETTMLSALQTKLSTGAKSIEKKIISVGQGALETVGLSDKASIEVSKVEKRNLFFQHLYWGDVPKDYLDVFKNKSISIISNMKELIDFKSKTSILNASKSFQSAETVNFEEKLILIVFEHYQGAKKYSDVELMEYDGNLSISRSIAIEDENCQSIVGGNKNGTSFQVILLGKDQGIKKNNSVKISTTSQLKFCSKNFGNYSQLGAAKKLEFEKIRELKPNLRNNDAQLSYQIFKNKWSGWGEFKKNYCRSCVELESKLGFPNEELLVTLQIDKADNSLGNAFDLHINAIYFVSGFWYFDVTKSLKCPEATNGQHYLLSLKKSDLPDRGVSLNTERVVYPGPFIPTTTKDCTKN